MDAIATSEAPAWARLAEGLAGVGYWRIDTATKRIEWSENMFRIFGFEPGVAPSLDDAMDEFYSKLEASEPERGSECCRLGCSELAVALSADWVPPRL